jgi:hypothetical protein
MGDDIRTRLAIANQARASTSGAIINLHGFTVGANAVVWSSLIVAYISIGGALPLLVFFGSAISAITIGVWRLYVQYLDNQIASLYPEIVLYEAMLPATPRLTGIRHHLAFNCQNLRGIFTANLTPEQQAQVVENLADRRSIGYRGHLRFNIGAIISTLILLGVSIGSVCYIHAPWTWYYTLLVIFIVAGLALVICALARGQKDPDENTVSDEISRITQQ